MAIIKTKLPNFNGLRASVMFKNSVGETKDEHLIEWFKEHGYEVIEPRKIEPSKLKRLEEMSVDELRAFLKENRMGIKMGSIKNKERLIELAKEVI